MELVTGPPGSLLTGRRVFGQQLPITPLEVDAAEVRVDERQEVVGGGSLDAFLGQAQCAPGGLLRRIQVVQPQGEFPFREFQQEAVLNESPDVVFQVGDRLPDFAGIAGRIDADVGQDKVDINDEKERVVGVLGLTGFQGAFHGPPQRVVEVVGPQHPRLDSPLRVVNRPPRLSQPLRHSQALLVQGLRLGRVAFAIGPRLVLNTGHPQPLRVAPGCGFRPKLLHPGPLAPVTPATRGAHGFSNLSSDPDSSRNAPTASAADSIRPANSRAVWWISVSTAPSVSFSGGFSANRRTSGLVAFR